MLQRAIYFSTNCTNKVKIEFFFYLAILYQQNWPLDYNDWSSQVVDTFNWWEIEGQGSGPKNTDYTIDTSPTLIHFTWLKVWKLVSSKTDGFLAPYRNIFCVKGVCQHVHLLASMAMRVDVTFVSTAQGCSLHVQELHSKSTLDLLWMCCDLRKYHTCMPPLDMTSPMDMKLLLTEKLQCVHITQWIQLPYFLFTSTKSCKHCHGKIRKLYRNSISCRFDEVGLMKGAKYIYIYIFSIFIT